MYVISDSWANCSQVKMLMKIEDCSCRKWAVTVACNFANVVIPHPCWSMDGGDPFGFSSPVACKMSQHAQPEEQSTMGNYHILISYFSPQIL